MAARRENETEKRDHAAWRLEVGSPCALGAKLAKSVTASLASAIACGVSVAPVPPHAHAALRSGRPRLGALPPQSLRDSSGSARRVLGSAHSSQDVDR